MDNKDNELAKLAGNEGFVSMDRILELQAEAKSSPAGAARQGGITSEESSAKSAAHLASQSQATKVQAVPAVLADIGKLIATQDNRITEAPMFVVEQKTPVISDADYNDCRVEWRETENGDYVLATTERAERLEALFQAGRETPGWRRYEVTDVWTFVTACFTEQGCKDYLARNGHNLRETRIYAYGSYRNEEFRAIRNWLKDLAPTTSTATASGSVPTDIARRLRACATGPMPNQDHAKLMATAADECDRFYNGMMAWKQTAQKKDADWNAERMERINERCADRASAQASQAAASEWISVDVRLPEHDEEDAAHVWASWVGAPGFPCAPRQGEARYIKSLGWQPNGCQGWDWIVTDWMPLPAAPALRTNPATPASKLNDQE